MRLLQHLTETGQTISGFAREVGVSESFMWRIAHGQREPSLRQSVKICRAAGWQVRPEDLLSSPADAQPPTDEGRAA